MSRGLFLSFVVEKVSGWNKYFVHQIKSDLVVGARGANQRPPFHGEKGTPMTGKPAARLTDAVACPRCGMSAIASGSADVQFDGLSAARQGDVCTCGAAISGQVIPNVLINGRPAVVQGSIDSHGGVVIGGSGSVIIGQQHTPAPFTPPAPLQGAGAMAAPSAMARSATPSASLPDELPQVQEEEEEEEELEADTRQRLRLRVFIGFDGTGNNAANSEVGKQCRAAAQQLDDEAARGVYERCKRYQLDPDSSYANDVSNVWRMHELYRDNASGALKSLETEGFVRLYISGIGTTSGEPDRVFPGQALGRGETGVVAKVEEALARFSQTIDAFHQINPEHAVEALELDIFGFSRGAAAARHFVNQILKTEQGPLGELVQNNRQAFAPGFALGTDVRITFIGLFDTVLSVGGLGAWGVPGDALNGEVDLYLPWGCAEHVVHLTAHDEHRYNFPLSRVSAPFQELSLPGAHSDLGGGYPPEMEESLYLGRPLCDWVSRDTPVQRTLAYRNAEQATAYLQRADLLDPQDDSASLTTDVWEHYAPYSGDRRDSMKYVLAAPLLRRRVRGHLSLVYLRVMHVLARDAGVPLKDIPTTEALSLPPELEPISATLVDWARRGSGKLSPEQERLLRQRYIHQSSNWNAEIGQGTSRVDVVFPNRPADGGRARYADQPPRKDA
ncbi:putative Zn-binding protein involved in type VI secretion [Pseudomonas citronellolis]|uniref:PAAR domain-containing protein n=1 Tax=Pseudomonas citronellolis TaxID=53408 RepID=UPI00209C9B93|nr:PAAR domain-containing protein [Pseudomonas citronellolis]MCP1641083.1 putative Zn-binding protein involved in type VI secretion [Pseudomonas citronellolis]MCP1664001.1 putative Zn-binding protein involved in type VI secretion [Pseudomonas citronellolis]MCP1700670.1 putative Zn-binding protein involved in type VI secretion [Pseudomonas citronellolis]MCP1707021.1 putative Zn-binding protein involved in type VI secretion [Pseudomonas citronellolis]MCP1800804.1 putative Zn-binding protein invo